MFTHSARSPLVVLFVAAIASTIGLVPLKVEAAAGRTSGTFGVSQSGEAQYNIPIFTPPGAAGLAPQLSLVYGHRIQEGYFGIGWSLTGLTIISRCSATWAQNGYARDVRNDLQDKFCLSGNQLKLSSGTYGVAGSIYRTEIETFARITAYGSAGNGPAYFVVEQKDGLIYEYGNSTDSRIESVGQSSALVWAVNKIRDRSGNEILFTYTEDSTNGSYRVNTIQYTRNTSAGVTTPQYAVNFVYETVPVGEVDSQYLAGSRIKRVTRVDRIEVTYNASTLVRRYELTYESSLSATYKSRLTTIQECGGSGSDCLSPTTINYQNATVGLAAAMPTSVVMPVGNNVIWSLDLNGDGRKDAVYPSSITSGSGVWMVAFANSTGGFNFPVNTGISNSNYTNAIPIDYDSDGRDDLLLPNYSGSTWWVALGSVSGLATPINTGAPTTATGTGPNSVAADIDGDGRQDLVWLDKIGYAGGDAIRYRLRLNAGGFSSTASVYVGPMPANSIIDKAFSWGTGQRTPVLVPDFNGDGRADITWRRVDREIVDTPPWTYFYYLQAQITGGALFVSGVDSAIQPQFADFNGDGRTDVLYRVGGSPKVSYSTGTYFSGQVAVPVTSQLSLAFNVLDWDGDGSDDILTTHNTTGNLHVIRSTGDAFVSPVDVGTFAASASSFTVGDFNGDTQDDLAYKDGAGTWTIRLRSGVVPDLVTSIIDGFGVSAAFTYAPTATYSNYVPTTGAVFPVQELAGSFLVVSNVQASNGIGGTFNLQNYTYEGARVDLQGRGSLGFAKRSWTDSRSGISEHSTMRQDFPFLGFISNLQTRQPGGTVIRETQAVFSSIAYGSDFDTRHLPYVSQTTTLEREVGGPYNGALLRTTVSNTSMDSTSGVAYDITTTATEASGANGSNPTQSYTSSVYLPVANIFTDTANWCIGRPGQTQHISSHSTYGGAALTRTSSATWNGPLCRPTQTVTEPGNSTLSVTTDIGYDAFGNVSSHAIVGKNPDGSSMTTRTATVSWGASGQFPETITNALLQSVSISYNYKDGTKAGVTDSNNITTSWQHDDFGRVIRETRPDGTATTTGYALCGVSCVNANHKFVVATSEHDTSGGVINDTYVYLDSFDRTLRTSTRTLTSGHNRVDTEYDEHGRVYRQGVPCLWVCVNQWITNSYDLIGRITSVSRPISDLDPALQYSTVYYEGLTTRTVDSNGKQSTVVVDVAGQIVKSIDHDTYYQQFDRNAFGNLIRVTDSAGNTLQTSTYNVRGVPLSLTDMDSGAWSISSNSLGETVSKTDAKSQTTNYGYDVLGRPVSRVEVEGTTTWTWGNSVSAKNVGRLVSAVGPGGIGESYVYDGIGRSSQVTYNLGSDGSYVVDFNYNSIGALHQVSYPVSTNGCRLTLEYGYSYGLHRSISNASNAGLCGSTGQTYWQATGGNPRHQITQETLGNGLITNRVYDSITSWVKSIQTGTGGGSAVQNLDYEWDLVGNLKQRQDLTQSIKETFTYDNLYRLDYSKVNEVVNLDLSYSPLGNIETKSDVGTYSYHASKKHAVVSTSNGWSFSYDANGNMVTGRGNTFTWTSYNKPSSIVNGSLSSQFVYGPSRNYAKQIATFSNGTSTTLYVGGLLEKVTSGGVDQYRHMIHAAGTTIIVSRATNGLNEVYYVTSDHLNSSSAITDSSGTVVLNSSFGAFGARRSSNWQGSPTPAEWNAIGATTRRGFTAHTMLDNLSLIHMNGRVQDPVLGRFVSADPFIDGALDTQGWNRFSYVQNRPLSVTDPSGFGGYSNQNQQNATPPVTTGSRIPGGSRTNIVHCFGNCYTFSAVREAKSEEALQTALNNYERLVQATLTIRRYLRNTRDTNAQAYAQAYEAVERAMTGTGTPPSEVLHGFRRPTIPSSGRISGSYFIETRRPTELSDFSGDSEDVAITVTGFRFVQVEVPWSRTITNFVGTAAGLGLFICIFDGCSGSEAAWAVGGQVAAIAIPILGRTALAAIAARNARIAGSIRRVNPTGSKTNCVNCAIATDSMLAGRPASALPSAAQDVTVLEKYFGAEFAQVSGQSAIEAQLISAGSGARGIVFGSRGVGQNGHVFNAVNQNGVVRFLDGQAGGAASFDDGFVKFFFMRTN
jgi:RHS repeat-associated protein